MKLKLKPRSPSLIYTMYLLCTKVSPHCVIRVLAESQGMLKQSK